MSRSWILAGLLSTVSLSSCSHDELEGNSLAKRPDVLVLSIDSLRADHLHCYGYSAETSPCIDALAAEGIRFETVISSTSWTLPAHAALFTGLLDSAHGLVDNGLKLGDVHETLAERMRTLGYRTAGFFGGPYLHPAFGLAQGFETYENCMTQVPADLTDEELRLESRQRASRSHTDVTGPRTVERVRAFLESAAPDPLFLFVHLWDVHYDYLAPEDYVRRFDADYSGSLSGVDFMTNERIRPGMDAREFQHLMALYDAEIRFTDERIAEILTLVRSRRPRDGTLIVVTADHGEEFLEHGAKGHQRTLFEEVVRIPWILVWPEALPSGIVVHDPVRLIDVSPTVLGLLGQGVPASLHGRNVEPLCRGVELPSEPAICELMADRRLLRAIRTVGHKLFVDERREQRVFFDLTSDPAERDPLAASSDEAQALAEDLRSRTQSALRQQKSMPQPSVLPTEMDLDLEERLRLLGYLDEEH